MPTADDHGATGVAGIMGHLADMTAHWASGDTDAALTSALALEAAVTKLTEERDEAERNVNLLSAALVDCTPPPHV